jgi:mRNA interferase MazF
VVIRRGDVWWASLPEPRGSEPGYRRPVLVVQADAFNESRIGTVLVATLTTNLRLAEAPGNLRLPRRCAGLPRECVVNVSQVLTLDRRFLAARVGSLPAATMEAVDEGLRLVLSL